MGKIRTAVVGLSMGLAHAQAYKASEKADLRWVVDLNEEKAKQVAEELGCNYTTDWLQIADDIDAVSLCTPHHLHVLQSLAAIERGKHVLLEKPFAPSEEQCLEVIRVAEEQGVTFMLAFIARYMPAVRKLKEILDSEQYGKAFNANCWVESYIPPTPGGWMSRKEALGGDVLFSHGVHYMDLLIWFFGQPMEVTTYGTRSGTEWMESEGTTQSIIRFENGAIASLVSSWGMKHRLCPHRYHIHTPKALLILDIQMHKLEAITDEGRQTLFEQPEVDGTNDVQYEVDHFLECIRMGRTPETDGYEALKSHQAIWSSYNTTGKENQND